MEKKRLMDLIEKLREEMKELVETKEFKDEKVLKKSRELDNLLNEYQKLIKKQKEIK